MAKKVRSESEPQYVVVAVDAVTKERQERAKREATIIWEATQILEKRWKDKEADPMFGSPDDSDKFFLFKLAGEKREKFLVAFLDTRHRLIACEELFAGNLDSATVHPRIIVQRGLELNAGAVILSHNHPSGDPTPSAADEVITRKIVDACKIVDMRVLDHIVVGLGSSQSMAKMGMV